MSSIKKIFLLGIMAITTIGCKNPINDSDSSQNSTKASYKFTDTVKVLESGTDGSAGISATYVLFGDFPQTVAAEGIIFSDGPDSTGYYVGSDGNYYAKVNEKPYEGLNIPTYSDNTKVKDDGIRYFKVEPIKWRVVDENFTYDGTNKAKLLVAENILNANISYNLSGTGKRDIGSDKDITPSNYKYSQIRAYLNGLEYYNENTPDDKYKNNNFLNTAFSSAARGLIKTTKVDNSAESTKSPNDKKSADDNISPTTEDKIFLLSESEVIKYSIEAWDADEGASRIRKPTDYAKANYAGTSLNEKWGGWWFLRSPHHTGTNSVRSIDFKGNTIDHQSVRDSKSGIVPALVVAF